MIDLKTELGVQSYTFRGFLDNAVAARMLKECGLSKIEIWGKHGNFADEAASGAAIATYRDAGVGIVAMGTVTFADNEAVERKFFEFAKRAGAPAITSAFKLDAAPQCFKTAERLADEFGINIAIHNHGGRDWCGNRDMLRRVFATTGPRIGLCLDTAWALDAGEDPLKMAEMFGQRLYGLHIKDFIFDRARRPEDVIVGTGNLDLPRLIELLRKLDFNGYACLEYEGDVDNPVPALKKCVEAVKRLA